MWLLKIQIKLALKLLATFIGCTTVAILMAFLSVKFLEIIDVRDGNILGKIGVATFGVWISLLFVSLKNVFNGTWWPDNDAKSANFIDKLHGLSKSAKACIVGMVLWTVFVIYRTADSHELLGMSLYRWDNEAFFMNWLGIPAIVLCIWYATQWVIKERKPTEQ